MANDQELMHHGILGQKHGARRFQYEDGTLTPAGRERYLKNPNERRDGSSITIAKPKKKVSKKALKQRQKAQEEKAKAEALEKKRAEKLRKQRANILQDPNRLMANLHNPKYDFDRKEIEDAIQTFKLEDQLLDLAKKRRPTEKTVSRGRQIAENVLKGLEITVNMYEKYNQLQNLINYGTKNPPKSPNKNVTFTVNKPVQKPSSNQPSKSNQSSQPKKPIKVAAQTPPLKKKK